MVAWRNRVAAHSTLVLCVTAVASNPPLSRFINFRQKNVLDKLNYTFVRKLVTGNQPKGQEKISGAASLQLAIR